MATHVGTIKEFQPDSDTIKDYLERVQLYIEANAITEDRQRAVLLSVMGRKTYSTLSNLLAPKLPREKTYEEITAALMKHYEPKRAVIAERFHFHKRNQAAGESMADYEAALRRLATNCKFGTTLDETLRDRFVCGLRNEAVQRRLLSETELTHTKAMEMAQAMEAAERNAKSFKGTEPSIHRFNAQPSASEHPPCTRCGRKNHKPQDCHFKDAECHACGKKGHISSACRSKGRGGGSGPQSHRKQKRHGTKWVSNESGEEDDTTTSEEFHLFNVGERSSKPIVIEVVANGKPLKMEIDTGAALSIISEETKKTVFPNEPLHDSSIILKTYTGEQIRVMGQLNLRVTYEGQAQPLVLLVVEGDGPSLFGRNWMKYIRPNWHRIASVHSSNRLQSILDKHSAVFKKELGKIRSHKATLQVQSDAPPKFFKPRPVPFALKDTISRELDQLEKDGILTKVTHSDWAAPIVTVPKPDGRIRICGDYKVTINQALSVDQYPLPKPEDLFTTLTGGKKFTKLDLSQAYLQLVLDEESTKYVTVNTHQGLYRYTRLPFGVASAPAMFQKIMDNILQGIPNVICYLDDILITGKDDVEHLDTLSEVLARLEAQGVRIKREKCSFMQDSVEYLGHMISSEGIQAIPEKVKAIVDAPHPKNVTELRSFLGLLNYYGKFIPNLATILHPLNDLLKANTHWKWSDECKKAFQEAKDKLTSSQLLTHYDPRLTLKMAADASAYGVGAVISHILPNGEERPIAFASRTLTSAESNYAQIEKEALALVFGVRKFHQYLFGRKFTLVTDHKPLMAILGPKKGIPSLAAARLQRWAILLSAYNYTIEFRATAAHANADGLSRLPLPDSEPLDQFQDVNMFNILSIDTLPVTSKDIQQATRRDPLLSKVVTYVQSGWPTVVPNEMKPFKSRETELGLEGNCLMWGNRIVIPTKLQPTILTSLHENHPGISRMKSIARSYVWWNGLDKAIETLAQSCLSCQAVKAAPPAAPLHPWMWPNSPWTRIHIDFAGPFQGQMFLIAVDAHSKWPEVVEMTTTTTTNTLSALRDMFGRWGLPEQIVSDNGPQFISEEFATFVKKNGIQHTRCAPYHPSSNGLAERFVQTFKRAMKASERDGRPLSHRLAEFLLTYRATPHATTGVSPSSLFLQRQIRTRFDLLKPDVKRHVQLKQSQQKTYHDRHSRLRQFQVGQPVMAKNFRQGNWVPGIMISSQGPLSYSIKLGDGRVWKRHVDHIRKREFCTPRQLADPRSPKTVTDRDLDFYGSFKNNDQIVDQSVVPEDPQPHQVERRYPIRDRRPPQRLDPSSGTL